MRQLNAKQKTLLNKYINSYLASGNRLYSHYDLTDHHLSEIVNINDHETIYQNIDRYISDYKIEIMYGGR